MTKSFNFHRVRQRPVCSKVLLACTQNRLSSRTQRFTTQLLTLNCGNEFCFRRWTVRCLPLTSRQMLPQTALKQLKSLIIGGINWYCVRWMNFEIKDLGVPIPENSVMKNDFNEPLDRTNCHATKASEKRNTYTILAPKARAAVRIITSEFTWLWCPACAGSSLKIDS